MAPCNIASPSHLTKESPSFPAPLFLHPSSFTSPLPANYKVSSSHQFNPLPEMDFCFEEGSLPAMDDEELSKVLINDGGDDAFNSKDDGTDESHLIFVLNMILSGTARLNVLLPTATILAFTIFAPLLTNDGKCEALNRLLMGVFLGICAASCVFFTFTDSFRAPSGRLYYGVATLGGIWTFNGGHKRPSEPSMYRLEWSDLFHALLSLVAFLTFAALNIDVVECYYPELPRKVTNTVPLVVGFVISLLFVVFPSKRRGIGYPFLLQRDLHYLRS